VIVPPGQGAARQPLHHHEFAEAIHRDPRQALALTSEEAQSRRSGSAEELPAHFQGVRETVGDRACPRMHALVRATRHHPHGHGMVPVDVAASHEFAVAGHEVDQATGGLRDPARSERLPIHPGVAEENATSHVIGQPVDSLAQ
jgi:hypothetical protein